MQKPLLSSPDALENKATFAILPRDDKAPMGANLDNSDQKI
jgi:hypothetical protein